MGRTYVAEDAHTLHKAQKVEIRDFVDCFWVVQPSTVTKQLVQGAWFLRLAKNFPVLYRESGVVGEKRLRILGKTMSEGHEQVFDGERRLGIFLDVCTIFIDPAVEDLWDVADAAKMLLFVLILYKHDGRICRRFDDICTNHFDGRI